MKVAAAAFLCLGFGTLQAMALPAQNNKIPRQNDMPKCEDGENGPSLFDMYDNAHCDNQCTYKETAEKNKYQACTGECVMNVPMPQPGGGQMPTMWFCSGTWSD